MKQLILITSFLAYAAIGFGQNLLVNFYPNNQPYYGLTNYPAVISPTTLTNSVIGWSTNMAIADYNALVANLTPIYNAGSSNALVAANVVVDANIAALVSSYSNLQWVADNFAYVTNTANIRIALKAIGDTLLRLKPVLTEWYQRSQTP